MKPCTLIHVEDPGLSGSLEPSTLIALKATYKGKEYRATLRKDGKIGYNGKIYESPSGAGKAVIKKTCNGWAFWRYKNEKGEWVRLKEIRK